uniref:ORF5a-encoded protein n=1 Tax=Cherry necrotic rusty mottle virus TaxID=129143 RepID=B2KTC8_9VIRU|nr:ORF5a-encoded protein [Cherry necrotic rusty mottle virus]
MTMEPSNSTLQITRSRRRRRLGRSLHLPEMKKALQERATLTSSGQEEGGSTLIPKIPPQVLAEILSTTFKRRTLQLSTLHLMTQLKQLQPIGLSTSRCPSLKHSIAFLMLFGTATTTVQVIKPNLLVEPNATLNLRNWRVLLGATVLYVAFAQNMRQ